MSSDNIKPHETGVPWIGKIPNTWESYKIKYGYFIYSGKTLQSYSKDKGEKLVPYFTTSHILWEHVITDNLPKMWARDDEIEKYKVQECDLLVCEGGEVGRSAVIEQISGDTITQNHVFKLRAKNDNVPKFLMYALKTINSSGWLPALSAKVGISNLASSTLGALIVPYPPPKTQTDIVIYLEKITGDVDNDLLEIQNLIELLTKKRQATIYHTITNGIESNVPMKKSRLEWITQIPKSWKYYRLKFLCDLITDGAHNTPTHLDEGNPMATVENMEKDHIDVESCYKISETDFLNLVKSNCQPKRNDILFSKDGTIGKTFVYSQKDDIVLLSSIAIIRTNKDKLDPLFCKFMLESDMMTAYLTKNKGGSGLKRLILNDIENFPSYVPENVIEQKNIAELIKEKIEPIDSLINDLVEQSNRLSEFRDITIARAITGKIMINS